jgi:hypothetical protein
VEWRDPQRIHAAAAKTPIATTITTATTALPPEGSLEAVCGTTVGAAVCEADKENVAVAEWALEAGVCSREVENKDLVHPKGRSTAADASGC